MKRFPWLSMRKKTAPELPYEPPIWLGNKSNGEYFQAATREDRMIRKLILEKCAENARKIGMDRRHFLASAMGMTTSLWVLNYVAACSSSSSPSKGNNKPIGGKDAGGDAGGGPDSGRFCVPKESMFDPQCANMVIGGDQFIFDVQTHWFNAPDLANYPAYTSAFGGLFAIATEDNYINTFFCNSETSMVALTSWPGISCTATRKLGCGYPLSNQHMADSRDKINALAGDSQRVVSHVQIMPQDPSGIEEQLRIMEEFHCNNTPAAWKLYPGFKPGFKLNDANGEAVLEQGLKFGPALFCVHKGLPIGMFFDTMTNYPDDIGPAAKKYPDAKIVVYHSGIFSGSASSAAAPPEGAFDENDTSMQKGVNALLRSVLDAGLKPGANVYGETGTAYSSIMRDATQSAHFFGKLMKYLGTDNVVWGTDSLASNASPQSQIETFRALEIPQDMQDKYGYPPLGPSTPEGKANQDKILGLNAAKIYGVDVPAQRCKVNTCQMTMLKEHLDEELGPRRWVFSARNPTYQEWLDEAEMMRKTGRPG